jgi:hypothetical protein
MSKNALTVLTRTIDNYTGKAGLISFAGGEFNGFT